MTNTDKNSFYGMADNEIAKKMVSNRICCNASYYCHVFDSTDCILCWIKWLEKEAGNG